MITYWWSRVKGKFVDKTNGTDVSRRPDGSPYFHFKGTTREWYETLVEVMIDVQNTVLKQHGVNGMRFMSWRADPIVYPIVECSVLHKPDVGREIGTIGYLDRSGLICNVPIEPVDRLDGTGTLQLWQYADSEAARLYGSVQIIDIGLNATTVEVDV